MKKDIEREREQGKAACGIFSLPCPHELKTPIAIIKGQLEGMIYQVGEYKDRDTYLRRCLKTTNDMEALVKEILSAAPNGRQRFPLGAHRPGHQPNAAKGLPAVSWPNGRTSRSRLRMDIQPEYHYQGDRRLMEKVFTNVIGNAVAYSPVGAVITVTQKDEVFSVENTGVHIAEEDLERIFTPFYRVDKSGTGIAVAAAWGCISPKPSSTTTKSSTTW